MILLTHETAAELLFAAGLLPASATEAGRAVAAEYRRRHGDLASAAADMADQFGDHPGSALKRMRACLAIAPPRVELPDSYGPEWLLTPCCDHPGCPATLGLSVVGRRVWCPAHLADRVRDALLAETAGDDEQEAGR